MKSYEVSSFNKNKTVSKGKSILILVFLIFGFIAGNLYSEVGDLPTVKDMWAKAIELHGQGVLAVPAMSEIWGNRASDSTLTDIATIIVGVYADTYWKLTKMDRAKLSSDLRGATSKGTTDCDNAANGATSQWHGILLRKNKNDTGKIPVTDNYTASYDVISNGKYKATKDQLIDNWDTYMFNELTINTNYLYVRGGMVGFTGEMAKAKGRIFVTDAGLNNAPTDWQVLYSHSSVFSNIEGKITGPLDYTNNPRGASSDFIYSPTTQEHVCLIATVATEFFENNPLDIPAGNWNSVEWITNNGAAAWHNMNVQKSLESKLKINNMDSRPERFAFEAHCDNLPKGTVVSLMSKDPKIAINTGPVPITNTKFQLVGTEGILPAHYKGYLIVGIKGPGGNFLPSGATVTVRMVWLLPHGHKHYMQAADALRAYDAVRESREIRVPMGYFTFHGPTPIKQK